MRVLMRPWGAMHYRIDGPEEGLPVLFANSLGTDQRLWDAVLPQLGDVRALRYDKPGHGLSDSRAAFILSDLAADAAALIEEAVRGPVVVVGLSIGGMIAQTLAADRPDLVRALVLSNTATRMGTAESWAARIAAVEAGGIECIADAVMERWFAPAFHRSAGLRLWRNMLVRTDAAAYCAACAAIAEADLGRTAARLRLPVLAIAGAEDGASPADAVEQMARLIPGSAFHVIAGAGHLPPVETPDVCAALLAPFIFQHGR